MARATLTQLKQLGVDSQAIADISDDDLGVALDAASARIDTALNSQFSLPILPPYPMDLIECECVLGSWTTLLAHGYNAQNADQNILKRIAYWEEYLASIARGETTPLVTETDNSDGDAGVTGPSVITATQRGYSERGINRQSPPNPNTDPFSSD